MGASSTWIRGYIDCSVMQDVGRATRQVGLWREVGCIKELNYLLD